MTNKHFILFPACGPGVVPKIVGDDFETRYRKWCEVRRWCVNQHWVINVDHTVNPQFDGAWYFKTQEQKLLFALRWL